MGLYCHTGTITKYLPGLLADGVGTGNRNYSNGDSGRGEYSVLSVLSPRELFLLTTQSADL